MSTNKKYKDPNDVLDYKFDFRSKTNGSGGRKDWLELDETINSHSIIADVGITVDSSILGDTNSSVIVWLSGGTAGVEYNVTARIVTNKGRTKDKTMIIVCEEQ